MCPEFVSGTQNKFWRRRSEEVPASPFAIPHLIWQTLYSRGIETTEQFEKLFNSGLKNLRNPFSLSNMRKAAERIADAKLKQESICIYADFDLDGTSGLALLKTGLNALGFQKVIGYQPQRLSEGYGVHVSAVKEIRSCGVDLMVTVDVGTTAFEALEAAQELGLDVIVTDHHLPQDKLPPCFTLVNPNSGFCESELQHLSGAGVAFYLCLAVRSILRERGDDFPNFDPKDLLDFFVIGTVTDMVPLVDENRILVKHGLHQLSRSKKPGLRALLEILELEGREVSCFDLGMKFAPKLNALSRLETGLRPIDMMLSSNIDEARGKAALVLACNAKRVELQKEAISEAQEVLSKNKPEKFIWVYSPRFHKGVIGLVATRLANDFQLPTFVGALGPTGEIIGSSRLPRDLEGLSLVDLLKSAESALVKFGGHAQAAGFETSFEKAEDFRRAMAKSLASFENQKQSEIIYDAEGSLDEMNEVFLSWHEALGPFGTGFEKPVYRFHGIHLEELKVLKGGHVKFEFRGQNLANRLSGIWFSAPADLVSQLVEGQDVEVVGEIEWNYFRGKKNLQIQIVDLKAI